MPPKKTPRDGCFFVIIKTMLLILIFIELIAITLVLSAIYFIGRPMLRGAIFFPTSSRNIKTIMRFADIKSGHRVVDLGSGDGRVIIAAAERGAVAIGYEINPVLVWQSRRAIARAGFQKSVSVEWKSFWKADLSLFDTVIVYGIPYVMSDLKKKMDRELKPNTKVISNIFNISEWKIISEENKVYLYIHS